MRTGAVLLLCVLVQALGKDQKWKGKEPLEFLAL